MQFKIPKKIQKNSKKFPKKFPNQNSSTIHPKRIPKEFQNILSRAYRSKSFLSLFESFLTTLFFYLTRGFSRLKLNLIGHSCFQKMLCIDVEFLKKQSEIHKKGDFELTNFPFLGFSFLLTRFFAGPKNRVKGGVPVPDLKVQEIYRGIADDSNIIISLAPFFQKMNAGIILCIENYPSVHFSEESRTPYFFYLRFTDL